MTGTPDGAHRTTTNNPTNMFLRGISEMKRLVLALAALVFAASMLASGVSHAQVVQSGSDARLVNGCGSITWDYPNNGPVPLTADTHGNLCTSATAFTYDAKSFCGVQPDGTTDNATALNACITTIGALSGGTIMLPQGTIAAASTIDNQYSNVMLAGAGIDVPHNTGSQLANCGTVLKWIGADGGTQIWFHSPEDVNGKKRSGGGVQGICFNSGKTTSNTGAAYQLRISSWNSGLWADNYFHEPQTCGILMDVVTSLFDPRDPQWNVVERNNGYNYAGTNNNANGGLLCLKGDVDNPVGGTGGTSRAANVSFNPFLHNHHLGQNGNGFDIYDTDHNYFYDNSELLLAGGTGYGIVLEGSNGSAGAARDNYITGWTGPFIAKGTSSFTTASSNNLLDQFDSGTGSTYTVETGASLWCGFETDGSYGSCTTGTAGATQDSLKLTDSATTNGLIIGPTHIAPNVGDVLGTRVNANAPRNISAQNQSPSSGAAIASYLGNDADTKEYGVIVNGSGNTSGNGASSTTVNAKSGYYVQGNGNNALSVDTTGNITTYKHLASNGTALACSDLTFSTGAGTSPTCTAVTGDDRRFRVSITTGTTPTASAQIFAITFKQTYGAIQWCTFAPESSAAAIKNNVVFPVPQSGGATLQFWANGTGLAASTAYIWSFQCIG